MIYLLFLTSTFTDKNWYSNWGLQLVNWIIFGSLSQASFWSVNVTFPQEAMFGVAPGFWWLLYLLISIGTWDESIKTQESQFRDQIYDLFLIGQTCYWLIFFHTLISDKNEPNRYFLIEIINPYLCKPYRPYRSMKSASSTRHKSWTRNNIWKEQTNYRSQNDFILSKTTLTIRFQFTSESKGVELGYKFSNLYLPNVKKSSIFFACFISAFNESWGFCKSFSSFSEELVDMKDISARLDSQSNKIIKKDEILSNKCIETQS